MYRDSNLPVSWSSGEGGGGTASDGIQHPSHRRVFPARGWDLARAEGTSGRTDGGNPHRSLCALLDPILPSRAHHPAVLLRHPAYLEEHLSLARVLELLLQPTHLHCLQQELQQRLQEPLQQAALTDQSTGASQHHATWQHCMNKDTVLLHLSTLPRTLSLGTSFRKRYTKWPPNSLVLTTKSVTLHCFATEFGFSSLGKFLNNQPGEISP